MENIVQYAIAITVVIAFWYLRGHRFAWALAHRDLDTCRSLCTLLVVEARWRSLARQLGLVLVDRTPVSKIDKNGNRHDTTEPKIKTPRIRGRADRYGIIVTLRTVPGVGLLEVQKEAQHLADAWHSVRVAVNQPKPGRVRIRAVRRDPLTITCTVTDIPKPVTRLDYIPIGVDEYADPVNLRLKGISGVGVYGLPGYGKTSFTHHLLVTLSSSPAVQFVVLDGKVDDPSHGDYGELADRIAVLRGDDMEEANKLLEALVNHRKDRANNIRRVLGVKDVWQAPDGPCPEWPLLIVYIDEAHTYFSTVKDGGDKTLKTRNALASQNVMYVEDLVKKGRAVGIITFVMTQKGTGDAIPTSIRDNCTVSLCYAVKTIDAAIAALGEDIRNWPDASPVALQDEAYIGVAVMTVTGRPGFTRVRMPYVPESLAAQACSATRQLAPTRGELPNITPKALTAG